MTKIKFSGLILGGLALASIANVSVAQTPSELKAQAFFFEAERALENDDYDTALTHVEKAQDTLGENNALLESIRVRSLYELGQYELAKTSLDSFYDLKPSESLNRSLASIIVKIDEKMDVIEKQQGLRDAIKNAELCFVDAQVKGETKTHSKNVWITKDSEGYRVLPGTFKMISETVVIQPAAFEDSTFETVDKEIVVQPLHMSFQVVPAEYEEIKVMIPLGIDSAGQSVEQEISRRGEILTASRIKEVVVPAVTKTIKVKKITNQGTSKIVTPAVTKQIQKRVLDTPASVVSEIIPGVTSLVEKDEEISPGRPERVYAMCDYKENAIVVQALRDKLKEKGYFSDLSETISAEDLDAALIDFQKKNDLPYAAELTQATFQALELAN